jgi:hypothetical protein
MIPVKVGLTSEFLWNPIVKIQYFKNINSLYIQ